MKTFGFAKFMALLPLFFLLAYHLRVYSLEDGRPQVNPEELRQTLIRTIEGEQPQ